MSKLLKDDEDLLDEIQEIRAKNNGLWVNILRFALRSTPQKTRAALRMIRENDMKVSELTGKVGEE